MKIAVLSPIFEPVPPKGWGGVELVVYNLVEELKNRGHEVTLFAADGSKTLANLVTNGLMPANHDDKQNADESQKILDHKLIQMQDEFDVIHAHTSHRFPYLEEKLKKPYCLTVHTIFRPQWTPIYLEHPNLPIISISKSQAKYSEMDLNFIGTVYNGIDLSEFDFSENPEGNYMAWIGRIVRVKGLLEAIEIAKETKVKLKFAGPFIYDNDDDKKFAAEVKEAMKDDFIEYVGEVSGESKSDFLKNAKVLINPIRWNEPFGLVVPEANACGTPAIAYNFGAMPELVKNDFNGFVVEKNNSDEFKQKIQSIFKMSSEEYAEMRQNSRKYVEENFTVEKMVDGYEKMYQKVISNWGK